MNPNTQELKGSAFERFIQLKKSGFTPIQQVSKKLFDGLKPYIQEATTALKLEKLFEMGEAVIFERVYIRIFISYIKEKREAKEKKGEVYFGLNDLYNPFSLSRVFYLGASYYYSCLSDYIKDNTKLEPGRFFVSPFKEEKLLCLALSDWMYSQIFEEREIEVSFQATFLVIFEHMLLYNDETRAIMHKETFGEGNYCVIESFIGPFFMIAEEFFNDLPLKKGGKFVGLLEKIIEKKREKNREWAAKFKRSGTDSLVSQAVVPEIKRKKIKRKRIFDSIKEE